VQDVVVVLVVGSALLWNVLLLSLSFSDILLCRISIQQLFTTNSAHLAEPAPNAVTLISGLFKEFLILGHVIDHCVLK
jgi:hypothetical protein